jgi:hypothetical protein
LHTARVADVHDLKAMFVFAPNLHQADAAARWQADPADRQALRDRREWLFWDNQDFMTNSVWAASRQRGEQQAMREALIVNRPADTSSAPQGLLLLFHGVGSNAEDLAPLGGVATLNLLADLGHGIDSRVGRRLAEHLGTPTP